MNKLSIRKLRYNQLFESENRELRLNEMGNPLEVLSPIMLILRSFVLLLNQPFFAGRAQK